MLWTSETHVVELVIKQNTNDTKYTTTNNNNINNDSNTNSNDDTTNNDTTTNSYTTNLEYMKDRLGEGDRQRAQPGRRLTYVYT